MVEIIQIQLSARQKMGELPLAGFGLKKNVFHYVSYSEHNTKFWK